MAGGKLLFDSAEDVGDDGHFLIGEGVGEGESAFHAKELGAFFGRDLIGACGTDIDDAGKCGTIEVSEHGDEFKPMEGFPRDIAVEDFFESGDDSRGVGFKGVDLRFAGGFWGGRISAGEEPVEALECGREIGQTAAEEEGEGESGFILIGEVGVSDTELNLDADAEVGTNPPCD